MGQETDYRWVLLHDNGLGTQKQRITNKLKLTTAFEVFKFDPQMLHKSSAFLRDTSKHIMRK